MAIHILFAHFLVRGYALKRFNFAPTQIYLAQFTIALFPRDHSR